jgi:putative flippase GtrA
MKTKKRTKQKKKTELVRFSEYMVSGGAQFWSGYAAFAVLDKLLGVTFWPAKIAAYFIGVTINFALERFWVFSSKKVNKRQVKKSAEKYYSLMLVNFVMDLAIVGGLREVGISPYIGQFIAAGFFTVWNYLWYRLWVFKGSPRKLKKA